MAHLRDPPLPVLSENQMSLEQSLAERSQSQCELCRADNTLTTYNVAPFTDEDEAHNVMLCNDCQPFVNDARSTDINHWRGLNETMWTPVPAVQVMAWRILKQIEQEAWAQDCLNMLYLDEETLAWAQTSSVTETSDCRDSNGTALSEGDSVTLIKDLDVKGANFTAKHGTMVKGIHLTDNPEQIEGRVNGVRIVLLTQFLKKA